MLREDPLSLWLFYDGLMAEPDKSTLLQITLSLDQLEALIRSSKTDKKRDFGYIRGLPGRGWSIRLPPMLRARVETLYPQVWESHGVRKHTTEEALLQLIGFTADPISVPFLRQTLAIGRVGDTCRDDRFTLPAVDEAHSAIGPAILPSADFVMEDQGRRPRQRAPMRPRTICLGHLDLPAGHEFLFHYDFGDDHLFEITVLDTNQKATPRARYPRVTDKVGRAPQQYDGR